MKVLLLGSTGLVGEALVQRLMEDSSFTHIYCPARRSLKWNHSKLQTPLVNEETLLSVCESIMPVDLIICALGTTINKAKTKARFRKVDYELPLQIGVLAKKFKVPQFLLISAAGAKVDSPFFYSQVKGELERDLTELQLNALHIFRPSLLLGSRREYRLSEKWSQQFFPPLWSLLSLGKKWGWKWRPIEATTLAEVMIQVARQEKVGNWVYEGKDLWSNLPAHLLPKEIA